MSNYRITVCRTPTNYNSPFTEYVGESELIQRFTVVCRGTKAQDIRFTDPIAEDGFVVYEIVELTEGGTPAAIHYEKRGLYPSHFSIALRNLLPDVVARRYAN